MSLAVAIHVVTAVVALLAGVGALAARKGSRPHRLAGQLFVPFMLAMAGSGALVAWTMEAGLSMLAGILTIYLVLTGWMTLRRPASTVSWFEWAAALLALTVGAGCVGHGLQVARGELLELAAGAPIPPGTYFAFGALALLAAGGDLRLLVRGGVSGSGRLARHLWRMNVALLISAASVFLGQPQVFPEWVRQTPFLLQTPVLAVLVLMVFHLLRVLISDRRAPAAHPEPAASDDV